MASGIGRVGDAFPASPTLATAERHSGCTAGSTRAAATNDTASSCGQPTPRDRQPRANRAECNTRSPSVLALSATVSRLRCHTFASPHWLRITSRGIPWRPAQRLNTRGQHRPRSTKRTPATLHEHEAGSCKRSSPRATLRAVSSRPDSCRTRVVSKRPSPSRPQQTARSIRTLGRSYPA